MPDAIPDAVESQPLGARGRWRPSPASLLAIAISTTLLVAVYRRVDVGVVFRALLEADGLWLVISIGMILPITVMRAVRFYFVAPVGALPSISEALRLILVASAFNVFLPAKTGDLAKSYFVATRSRTPAGVALAMALYERLCDLFALTSLCFVAWALVRPQLSSLGSGLWLILGSIGAACAVLVASERVGALAQRLLARSLPHDRFSRLRELAAGWPALLGQLKGRRRWIVSYSLALWLMHLLQLWLFTVALSLEIPFTTSASLLAVALMAGQLPFTVAGLGARDLALVVLLAGYTTPEHAAALAVLIATRGLLPPLFGLAIMRPYLSLALEDARKWRAKLTRSAAR